MIAFLHPPTAITMNTTATPRRILVGFLLIVLLTTLLGLWSLWQIVTINRNVSTLATNSVPSVVILNQVIQTNAAAAKSVMNLVRSLGSSRQASALEAAFSAAKTKGDGLCKEYESLLSDAEDSRLFGVANSARDAYFAAAAKAIELARDQKQAEADAFVVEEVEPLLDRAVDGFNKDIDYNIVLAGKEAELAQGKVTRSLYMIPPLLAGVALLGGLIGWTTAPVLHGRRSSRSMRRSRRASTRPTQRSPPFRRRCSRVPIRPRRVRRS